MYSNSSQLQGGFTQSTALYKCSRPHSSCSLVKLGFVDFSLCKNIVISSEPHSLKYFVSLAGRQFRCGLSTREGSLSMKLDMPSCHRVSSISWNWRGMHQKIGGTAGGLCLGFSVSGSAKAEISMDRKMNCAETSASSTHGKKVYTDYSVTGEKWIKLSLDIGFVKKDCNALFIILIIFVDDSAFRCADYL